MSETISEIKTALLFSGQGSQYVGMLKDIAEQSSASSALVQRADEILGYKLSKICFEGPLEKLKETRYTQPAIYLHSAVIFELIRNMIKFDAAAGHSVGEYSALFAAGVIQFEDALRLVALRGKLMYEAGTKQPGTMFAVIGLDDEKVIEISNELTRAGNGNIVVAANFNSTGQVVISGSAEYLRNNISEYKKAGARMVQELVVSGAFHTRLMQPAKEELEEAINKYEYRNATVPVYSNVSAEPLTDSEDIKKALIMQLTSPVLWTQTMHNMNRNGNSEFIEIGPGKVLQGLIKRTLQDVSISGIDKYEDYIRVISQ